MTEKPILFSRVMVNAIREGRKTQTRRVVKPQPCEVAPSGGAMPGLIRFRSSDPCLSTFADACPYGQPGSKLWVRETWCRKCDDGVFTYNKDGNLDSSCCYYAADGEHVVKDDGDGGTEFRKDGTEASPWVPSIHMPRWASRLTLEITGIRVERLQEISEADAKAEGVTPEMECGDMHFPGCNYRCRIQKGQIA